MVDIIRDSTIGQFINFVSDGKLLPYPEQRPDFVIPPRFLQANAPVSSEPIVSTLTDVKAKKEKALATVVEAIVVDDEDQHQTQADVDIVGWYSDDDPDNPKNWSSAKRAFVAFSITFMTFTSYVGSAIYTPSIPGLMANFNSSLPYTTLGLTLYVFGYGIGPMFLSPLQELTHLGRNTIYMASLFLFIIFQIPTFTATNLPTILGFRFVTGFFCSPALATGGASMSDMYPMHQLAYVIGIWAQGVNAGPIIGPVIGGFAAMKMGWQWPEYELIWLTAFSFVFLMLLLPETYGPTILHRRAQRLRTLTGNLQLSSQGERDTEGQSLGETFKEAILRPFILAREPTLMFANIYLGFVYAIFYLWYEAFPLVFTDIYHFNLGESGLPFIGFLVSSFISYIAYALYQKYLFEPRSIRAISQGAQLAPETRLEIGLIGSLCIPVSLFIFGFASRANVHWIVPIIGASFYIPGIFLNFQSILMYISISYPMYAASVLAANDLFRSTIASVFPLFGRHFFVKLGLGPASSLLAGISLVMMPVFWSLMKWGHVLRHRSKYASD
ncbi:major facilitator superfamily domain-containing protein [Lentinula aciculospora]|uniref:Major facilitator superfamily domain-containing protein n=1 Tax=Lentinula aciculospora TaxID=153920 RepID=A0A9W9AUQ4_9AGAR|nr:major facilitator superfamily domain-containing protein [Lentinula aciculospora]